MKATFRDLGHLLHRPKVIGGFIAVILLSAIVIEQFGYLIWRRFPMSVLVIATALIWMSIAKSINQPQLSKMVRVMAVGLCSFGVSVLLGAFVDGIFFAVSGYITFVSNVLLWTWIAFESYRGWQILTAMTPEKRQRVTESATVIIAEMTATEQRIEKILAESAPILDKGRLKFS